MRRGLIYLGGRIQMLDVTSEGFLGGQPGVEALEYARPAVILVDFLLVGEED